MDTYKEYCRCLTDRQLLNLIEDEKQRAGQDGNDGKDYEIAKAEAERRGLELY